MIALTSVMSAPIPVSLNMAAGFGAAMALTMVGILLGAALAIVREAVSAQRSNRAALSGAHVLPSVVRPFRIAVQGPSEPPIAA